MVQGAGAEPVGRLFQRTVGGLADHAVDQQAAVLLKCADGLVEAGVEHFGDRVLTSRHVRVGMVQPSQRGQGSADLGDRAAAVAAAQSGHRGAFRSRSPSRTSAQRWAADRITSYPHCRRWFAELRKRQAARAVAPAALKLLGEFAQQRRLALGADDPLYRFTALEQDHRRNRDDLEIARRVRIDVDVDLGDREVPGPLAGDLLQYGRDHPAGPAPRCPEVDEDWSLVGEYVLGERLV